MGKSYTDHHGHSYPYFKIQYWEEKSMCWMDVQKVSYSTEKEARAHFLPDKKCRVMQVEEKKRFPLP